MPPRELLDAPGADVAVVETPEEFQNALERVPSHIEIREHLDLRSGDPTIDEDSHAADNFWGHLPFGLVSIRGNCSGPPPKALLPDKDPKFVRKPLLPVLERQCLLLLDTGFFHADARLWLDGLYIRVERENDGNVHVVTAGASGNVPPSAHGLWLTDVTIQSDSGPQFDPDRGLTWGLQAWETSVYAEGCTFADLGGIGACSPVDIILGSADFVNCTFRDNFIGGDNEGVVQGLFASSVALHSPIFSGNYGTGALLQAVESDHEDDDGTFTPGDVRFFSDTDVMEECDDSFGVVVRGLEESNTKLSRMTTWLEQRRQELGRIDRPLPPAEAAVPVQPNAMGCCSLECFENSGLPAAGPSAAGPLAAGPLADGPFAAGPLTGAPLEAYGPLSPAAADPASAASPPASAPAPVAAGIAPAGQLPPDVGVEPVGFPMQPDLGPLATDGRGTPVAVGDAAGVLPRTASAAAVPAPSGGDGDLSPEGIVAVLLGVIVLTLLVAFAVFAKKKWRKHSDGEQVKAPALEKVSVGMSGGSMNFGPHMAAVTQKAQHSQHGPAETAHDPTHVRSGVPAEQFASGSLNVSDQTTLTNNGENTAAPCMSRIAEAAPPADTAATGHKSAHLPAAVAAGGPAVAAGATAPTRAVADAATAGVAAGATAPVPRAQAQAAAEFKAMFQPPTDLGTLAESNAWQTMTAAAAAPLPPLEGAGMKERLTYIAQQLDAFGPRGELLGRYEKLGGDDRCRGGQAVVQFVRAPQNNCLYAIKFFASRAAYDGEKGLYLHQFAGFMPTAQQFVDNEDGAFRDPFGVPMPPCIVMEKGESLAERSLRCKNDIFTTIQVIGQVASCLAELHGQGWVHRDLKPGNIMFLPRTGSWTLIDFGLAARTGETTRMGFTLAYAPPEVVALHRQGANSVEADPAVDAWALGVMAFEMLTGGPAFSALTSTSEQMERQLLGEEPLPWEDANLTADMRRRLGAIKTPVLRTLCRDPAQRASCKDLAAALRSVFAQATTVESDAN